MDLRKIKKLIDLLEESNLAEIEIKEGEESVRLARTPQGGMVAMAPAASYVQAAPAAAPMPMNSPVQAATGSAPKPAAEQLPDGDVVRSPMVGTFYASPAPDKPPFVEPGSSVEADDPVCIVDVMKMFTRVPAGSSGTIVDILVEDGTLVEHGQVLMTIRPR